MISETNNLILELNYNCNNNCIYCYIPENKRFKKSYNNLNFFKKKLMILKEKNIKNVDFSGGEPTLYPHLLELVKYSKNIGYDSLTLVSNGKKLFYKDFCNKLIDEGINRFVISVDGPNKFVNDSITRTEESYKYIFEAINNILEKKIEIGISMVVNSINYKHIPKLFKKLSKLDISFINVQFILPYVRDKKVPCRKLPNWVIPSYKDSTNYVKKSIDLLNKKIKVMAHFIPFCYFEGYEKYISDETINSNKLIINFEGFSYYVDEHLKKGAIKTKKCKLCDYENKCVGFFPSYAKELGITHEITK